MSRKDKPTEKVTLHLFKGQFKWLKEYHPRIGASAIIRNLVDRHIQEIKSKQPSLDLDPKELME